MAEDDQVNAYMMLKFSIPIGVLEHVPAPVGAFSLLVPQSMDSLPSQKSLVFVLLHMRFGKSIERHPPPRRRLLCAAVCDCIIIQYGLICSFPLRNTNHEKSQYKRRPICISRRTSAQE